MRAVVAHVQYSGVPLNLGNRGQQKIWPYTEQLFSMGSGYFSYHGSLLSQVSFNYSTVTRLFTSTTPESIVQERSPIAFEGQRRRNGTDLSWIAFNGIFVLVILYVFSEQNRTELTEIFGLNIFYLDDIEHVKLAYKLLCVYQVFVLGYLRLNPLTLRDWYRNQHTCSISMERIISIQSMKKITTVKIPKVI